MPVITATAEPTADTQIPTTTHYQQVAAEVMKVIDEMAAVIPQTEEAGSGVKLIRTHLNVPNVFCERAVVAVEQLAELQASKKLDAVAGRNKLQFIEAFRPMSDKLSSVVKLLDYTLMWAKATLAEESLQIYRITKSLASDKRSPLIQAHAENMKRDLGRKGLTKAQREVNKLARLRKAAAEANEKEVKKAA